MYRMPCGRKVALKIALCGSHEEVMLRAEATAYLALQDLWNKGIPELLLAGDLRALGGGYGLGTCVLPGRLLQKGLGRHFVPNSYWALRLSSHSRHRVA